MLEQNTVQCAEMNQYTGEERRNLNFMFTMQCALLLNAIFVNLVSVFKINDAPMSKAYQIQRSNNESRLNLKDKVDGAKIIFTFNENCRCIMSK